MLPEEWDVIVVGGGGSGLAAAVSAAEGGLRVLLLEKNPQLGGSTGIAVGSFTGAETDLQRAQGIEDRVDWHVEDAGKFAKPDIEARNNGPLRAYFLSQAAETLAWIRSMGVTFQGPHPEPPNRQPRMHNVVPNAKSYIAALDRRLRRLGGRAACDAPVRQLIQEDNTVVGVEARIRGQVKRFRATRGVVLATGDYANASAMIARHKGDHFRHVEGINPTALGEGHALAESVGAQLLNMDVTYGPELRFEAPPKPGWLHSLPTRGPAGWLLRQVSAWTPPFVLRSIIKRLLVTWQHPEDALLTDGAILVNRQGQRFCDETAWPDREIATASQSNKQCFLLLDERLIARYGKWPHFISTAPEIAYAYVRDYLRLRPDIAVESTDLSGLAAARDIDTDALPETVAQYNQRIAAKESDPFGRVERSPLSGDRWILLGPARAYFTTTEGGAAITQQCEVLDAQGDPIRGLYAVGQIGLGGQVLFGHGLHIAWALTSGRLVGRALSHQANQGRLS